MEFAVTAVIVAAAALFVTWRWVRSVKQGLSSKPSDACGGNCAGCTASVDLCTTDGNPPSADNENRKALPPSAKER